jgi:hypothetical protein
MKSLLVLLSVVSLKAFAAEREIIVYGQNAPEWNKNLGVTATRSACNGTVDFCMTSMAALMAGQHTSRFYLNLFDDPKTNLERAKGFGERSLAEPRLRELGIDDFPDHWNGWCHNASVPCEGFLRQIIENAKSKNPALKFGVTIYEDQIAGLLANPRFTADLRGRIDNVHLALHDRNNGPRFETYLAQIKRAFPRAQVIGVSYTYDRLDYEKCTSPSGGCGAVEARELNKKLLRVQARLLKEGVLAGIEFYPGHFGWEEKWPAWNDPKICKPERKADCIENTRVMHGDAVAILKANQ